MLPTLGWYPQLIRKFWSSVFLFGLLWLYTDPIQCELLFLCKYNSHEFTLSCLHMKSGIIVDAISEFRDRKEQATPWSNRGESPSIARLRDQI